VSFCQPSASGIWDPVTPRTGTGYHLKTSGPRRGLSRQQDVWGRNHHQRSARAWFPLGWCPIHSVLCVEAIPVRARIQIAAKFVLPGLLAQMLNATSRGQHHTWDARHCCRHPGVSLPGVDSVGHYESLIGQPQDQYLSQLLMPGGDAHDLT
jgi:hypothetical protein